MGSAYDWLRGLHIIAVIAWMAGLMMLPRIFVYHMSAEPGSKMDQVFKDAERRLLGIVMTPAAVLSFALGSALIWYDGQYRFSDAAWAIHHPWMLVKLAGVAFLIYWHWFLMRAQKTFAAGTNTRTEKFCA